MNARREEYIDAMASASRKRVIVANAKKRIREFSLDGNAKLTRLVQSFEREMWRSWKTENSKKMNFLGFIRWKQRPRGFPTAVPKFSFSSTERSYIYQATDNGARLEQYYDDSKLFGELSDTIPNEVRAKPSRSPSGERIENRRPKSASVSNSHSRQSLLKMRMGERARSAKVVATEQLIETIHRTGEYDFSTRSVPASASSRCLSPRIHTQSLGSGVFADSSSSTLMKTSAEQLIEIGFPLSLLHPSRRATHSPLKTRRANAEKDKTVDAVGVEPAAGSSLALEMEESQLVDVSNSVIVTGIHWDSDGKEMAAEEEDQEEEGGEGEGEDTDGRIELKRERGGALVHIPQTLAQLSVEEKEQELVPAGSGSPDQIVCAERKSLKERARPRPLRRPYSASASQRDRGGGGHVR
jgi:hypothetical protein